MTRRFTFADAFWFRLPLRALMVATAAFGLIWLYPALESGARQDFERALFGLIVVAWFLITGAVFAAAINDGYVEVDDRTVYVRFEAFFTAEFPVADIVRVTEIDPRPRWRYRFGLSTNFRDRIACSHGGRIVEIELANAWPTRLWPRNIPVRRFWIAVNEPDDLLAHLHAVAPRSSDALRVAA